MTTREIFGKEPKEKRGMCKNKLLIGVLGPCGSGKSTLIAGLKRHGYQARHIGQEHSYVPDMWQRLTKPNVLIFLDASYHVTCQRKSLRWNECEYTEEQRRLAHAREHADFYLLTDQLSIKQVLKQTIGFLEGCG